MVMWTPLVWYTNRVSMTLQKYRAVMVSYDSRGKKMHRKLCRLSIARSCLGEAFEWRLVVGILPVNRPLAASSV